MLLVKYGSDTVVTKSCTDMRFVELLEYICFEMEEFVSR